MQIFSIHRVTHEIKDGLPISEEWISIGRDTPLGDIADAFGNDAYDVVKAVLAFLKRSSK